MKILGIESTAHTFGVGVVEDGKVLSNEKDMFVPEKGGIHPRKAAEHHSKVSEDVLRSAWRGKPDAVAYSCGPGIGPCLAVGKAVAVQIGSRFKIPLIPVNHAVAHLKVGVQGDPVIVYASGGNTQVIVHRDGWKVLGETQDIALGNAIDKLARELGFSHPGGPKLEKLAHGGEFIEMPYTVKGMDLSFSGIFTHAKRLLKKQPAKDVAYSFQEHTFAMLVEVAERALSHMGRDEVLLVGGVAQNKRLQQMFRDMCEARGARFETVPPELAGDNGAMIAYAGQEGFKIEPEDAEYFQNIRVDTDLKSLFSTTH